jgi:glycosyltransferase involved in cell wall biosynthesis
MRKVAEITYTDEVEVDPESQLRRRLLVVLPFTPRKDAPHGGRVVAQLLQRLAGRHEVALLCLRRPFEPPVDPALREACALVDEVALADREQMPGGRIVRWAWLGMSLLRGRPMEVAEASSNEFRRRLRRHVDAWKPDAVQFELLKTAQYLSSPEVSNVPEILVDHDPGIATARDVWLASRRFERLVRFADLLAWRRFEPKALRRAAAIVVFTERDRQDVEKVAAGSKVFTIPFVVDVPASPLDPVGESPPRILFVGGFGHPPNVDAAIRLAGSIFPLVHAQHEDAALDLVGDKPPDAVRKLQRRDVNVTGRVNDVTPYLDRASVVVAPLRLGGGMRLKVLESLAAGKAVVASPLAAEGIDVMDGENIFLAESDLEFVHAIDQLLADPELRRRIATQARLWAEANLAWDKTVSAYERLYERVALGEAR